MSDIVERLRAVDDLSVEDIFKEAAAEILKLRNTNSLLIKALNQVPNHRIKGTGSIESTYELLTSIEKSNA